MFTWRHNGKVAIFILYIDDFLLAGNDKEKLEQIKLKLCAKFQMKVMGEPNTEL